MNTKRTLYCMNNGGMANKRRGNRSHWAINKARSHFSNDIIGIVSTTTHHRVYEEIGVNKEYMMIQVKDHYYDEDDYE